MNTPFLVAATCLITVCTLMLICYVWARRIENYGVVDIFWAYNFLVIALIIFFLSPGQFERRLLVCGLLALWSIRLGTYLLVRVGSHLREEEGRYRQLRSEWSPAKFFGFFQMQAVSNVFLALPFFVMAANTVSPLGAIEIVGAALWLICILGEAIADQQLRNFKSQPQNKGKVCDAGLWNYSRHPNYFFQLGIWISVALMALASPMGWLGLLCPLSIGFLLFKVTGIPMTEEQALRSKGAAYADYQKTTSMFIPWFKKELK